jgi:hypothetical protein
MKFVFSFLVVALTALALFFAYYSVRLLYINLAVQGVAEHRQGGMYVGAIVFPIATLVFGWLSLWSFRKLRKK